MDDRIARLGMAVKSRRQQMGYTQQDVTRDGGPSDTTQTGIELGTASGVSTATLRKLDIALRWKPGSAKAVMDGGNPTVLDEPTDHQAASSRIDNLAYLTKQIAQLSADINALARNNPELHDVAGQAASLAGFAASASYSEITGGPQSHQVASHSSASAGRSEGLRVEPEEDEHIAGIAARKGRSKKG